jgi:hypothetical protein
MAQDISEKIRAAAVAKGIDPDLAVRIAKLESSLRPEVGAKTSSAKGLFGIIDSTWNMFGGAPGQQTNADENIRVGTDIIASNTGYLKKKLGRDPQPSEVYAAHFFGPTGAMKFLSADPDTSMESVFSKKVMDANPHLQGKTTQQIRGMLAKKVGGDSTAVASSSTSAPATPQAQPKSGIQRAVYKAAPLTHPMLSQLGPNYQAALAVSMLADQGEKEGKSEDDESESEKMMKEYMETPARPVALASADLGYQTPFPAVVSSAPAKEQLQAYKHGGVVHMADGGDPEYFQDPMGVPDSGPITADTFVKGKEFRAADALQAAKEVGKGMVRSGRAALQGVSETPYNLVGAPVDIATMAMRPFGYNVEAPVGGSDWLKKQALEAGIRQAPPTDARDLGFYTMGELGAGFVNPGPIAAKVGQATEKAVTTGSKAVAREMLRGMEGQGVLAPVSPQDAIMYAVKPRGGTSLTSGSLDKPPISKIDKTIEQWFERTVRDAPDAETTKVVRDFLDKKGRKYLTTELGTGADPIRTAMASGEIQPVGSDVARFPEYLLHAARTPEAPGHLAAKKDLENLYDRASTVEGRVVGMHDPADADARSRFNALIRQNETNARNTMAQEGVPQELQNPSIQGISGNDLGASYSAGLRDAIGAPQEFPAIAGAVQRGQPIYDLGYQGTYMDMFSPKTVAENINAIPPKRLKNMSFADAMIEGSKRMEVSRNYDKAVEMVAKGANVPKEVTMQFTKPITETDKGQWVQLTDKMATKMEGKMLHHSVGGYADSSTYGHGGSKGFDAGDAKVFSLRDPKTGLAKVTVEGKRLDDGRTEITQIKGDFNSFPEQYTGDLFNFFDHMGYRLTFPKSREYYRNGPNGEQLDNPVIINWGNAYEQWALNKKAPFVSDQLPPPPAQIDIPFAKGGMVERQASTARYI